MTSRLLPPKKSRLETHSTAAFFKPSTASSGQQQPVARPRGLRGLTPPTCLQDQCLNCRGLNPPVVCLTPKQDALEVSFNPRRTFSHSGLNQWHAVKLSTLHLSFDNSNIVQDNSWDSNKTDNFGGGVGVPIILLQPT
jgi:hypothetical protein